jgi:transglutaminase-like putative cysteine protease
MTVLKRYRVITYQAEVELRHYVGQPDQIGEMPIADLPTEVLPYLYPSRYCESDKLQQLANELFGHLAPGYRRVESIRDWVRERTRFTSGSSTFITSAVDTLHEQVGVCRDYAHLMITLCRALNIPARFSSGARLRRRPQLRADRFSCLRRSVSRRSLVHLRPLRTRYSHGLRAHRHRPRRGGHLLRHHLRHITSDLPLLSIDALVDPVQGCVLPWYCAEALSTDTPSW